MVQKSLVHTALLAVLLGCLAVLVSQLLLRNLYLLLSFDETFSGIFAQIRTASMGAPVIFCTVTATGAAWICRWLWEQKKRKFWAVAVGIIVELALFFGNVLLTRVNGIRFGDVLFSLVEVLQKGGLG